MKKIFAYLTLGFTTLTTYAATPLWMRDIQISPDGTDKGGETMRVKVRSV